jgi:hypothetical protein
MVSHGDALGLSEMRAVRDTDRRCSGCLANRGLFLAFQGIAATGAGGLGAVSAGLPEIVVFWLVGVALGFFVLWR